jgi:hypothetical protein
MAQFADVVRYIPTAGGTADFTFAAAVTGYQSPAAAGVVNGATYRYRAESGDLTQWELGFGTYNTGTGVLTRTVTANNLGTLALINFSSVPQVAFVVLAADLYSHSDISPWATYTPTITAQTGTFTGATITATARWLRVGRAVFLHADVTLTALGSGSPSAGLRISLPATAAAFSYAGCSSEININGRSGTAVITANGTFMDTREATAASWIVAGARIIAGITYETA